MNLQLCFIFELYCAHPLQLEDIHRRMDQFGRTAFLDLREFQTDISDKKVEIEMLIIILSNRVKEKTEKPCSTSQQINIKPCKLSGIACKLRFSIMAFSE